MRLGPDEGVSEDHRQLVLAEGDVALRVLHRSDALLQSQERLVDLGSLLLPSVVVGLGILSSLGAGEVNEEESTTVDESLFDYLLDGDGADGVRPRGGVVGRGGLGLSDRGTVLDEIKHLSWVGCVLLLLPNNLNLLVLVFLDLKRLVVIE